VAVDCFSLCGEARRAHEIELDDALDVVIILFRQSESHEGLIFTQVVRDDKSSAA